MGTKYNLVCVAHPDDETIFFGGLLLQLKKLNDKKQILLRSKANAIETVVICMTDANADGQGRKRKQQFTRACRALGVAHSEWWGFPDIYEKRLPVDVIEKKLLTFAASISTSNSTPNEIYTHGIVGEYGHPHHQDVSYAVHRTFINHPHLYSVAYNSFPEKRVILNEEEYTEKARILTKIYGSETVRFLNLLPVTSVEGFHQLKFAEVDALYKFFVANSSDEAKLNKNKLDRYRWLADYLKLNRERPRPF